MPENIKFCEGVFAKLIVDKSTVTFGLKTTMKIEVNYSNRSGTVEKVQQPSSTRTLRRQVADTLYVLVVEYNSVNQRVLAKQLHNLGCVVYVANHSGEALDFFQKTNRWNDTKSPTEGQELSVIMGDAGNGWARGSEEDQTTTGR